MTPIRRRLAIAVAPRLLGEALSRVLARENRDVVVFLPEEADSGQGDEQEDTGPFDIAVVSHDGQALPASVVIRLPDTPTLGAASVRGKSVPITDLDSLVELVERCSAELDPLPPIVSDN